MSGTQVERILHPLQTHLSHHVEASGLRDPAVKEPALRAAAAGVLQGLLRNVSTPGGAETLLQACQAQDDSVLTRVTHDLAKLDTETLTNHGRDSMRQLFGAAGSDSLAASIGSEVGISKAQSTSVLTMVTPVALASLKQMVQSGGLNAAGLASMLRGQSVEIDDATSPELRAALESHGFLSSLSEAAIRQPTNDETMSKQNSNDKSKGAGMGDKARAAAGDAAGKARTAAGDAAGKVQAAASDTKRAVSNQAGSATGKAASATSDARGNASRSVGNFGGSGTGSGGYGGGDGSSMWKKILPIVGVLLLGWIILNLLNRDDAEVVQVAESEVTEGATAEIVNATAVESGETETDVSEAVTEQVADAADTTENAADAVIEEAGDAADEAGVAVSEASDEVAATAEGAVEEVADAADGAVEEVADAVDGATEEAADAADGATEEVADAADGATEEVADAADGAAEEVADATEGATDAAAESAEETAADASEVTDAATEEVGDAVDEDAGAVSEAIDDAGNALADAADSTGDVLADAAESVKEGVAGAAATAVDLAGDAKDAAADAVESVTDAVTEGEGDSAEVSGDSGEASEASDENVGAEASASAENVEGAAAALADGNEASAEGEASSDSEEQAVTRSSFSLGGISRKLGGVFGTTSALLGSVTDGQSAEAALPRLEEANASLGEVVDQYGSVPDDQRGPLQRVVSGGLARLKPVADTVMTKEGVGPVLGSVVDSMMEKLRGMAN